MRWAHVGNHMKIYRHIFGTAVVDIFVNQMKDGGYLATAYAVLESSLARRPILEGSTVLNARCPTDLAARDELAHALATRLGPLGLDRSTRGGKHRK